MLIKPKYIFIHHSLTKDSKTVSWDAIRRYHKGLGWRDIGYHYGIELINKNFEILLGRMEGTTGAHTRGYNRNSIGICLVGNYDIADVPDSKWKLTQKLVKNICLRYDINADNVLAHREVASYKSCPGNRFDIDKFRFELNEQL
jgi:N-acetylmuramoyl-L-alanine amidase